MNWLSLLFEVIPIVVLLSIILKRCLHNSAETDREQAYQLLQVEIEECKQREKALRETEKKYHSVFNNIKEVIFQTDVAGLWTFLNIAWTEITGFAIEESIGNPFLNYVHPEDRQRYIEIFQKLIERQKSDFKYQIRLLKKSNEFVWIEVFAKLTIDANNTIVGISGTLQNITEQKHIEEALQLADFSFERCGVPGIWMNRDGRIFRVNQAACQMLGYSRKELESGDVFDFDPNFTLETWQAHWESLKQYKTMTFCSQLRAKSGNIVPIEVSINYIEFNGKEYNFCFCRDVTERHQAEMTLRQQNEREKMISAITQNIRQSLDLTYILNTTVGEVRRFLSLDRVVIYRFNSDFSGTVIVESVGGQWTPTLGEKIRDSYLMTKCATPYQTSYIQTIEDIYTANLSECHIKLLAKYEVRANLVVPISKDEELWGLLVAYQCSKPRQWQQWEIDCLSTLSAQLAIAISQAELYRKLEIANQELHRLATIDNLTQIANRRRFDQYLENEWCRLAGEQSPLSLILCDVDYFKLYNDTYGHLAGDECLKQIAKVIKQVTKCSTDLVARYGGEEFAIILPNTTSKNAFHLAEHVQLKIEELGIIHGSSLVSNLVTLSLGIASVIPCDRTSPLILVSAADKALYKAKEQGRNRIAGL